MSALSVALGFFVFHTQDAGVGLQPVEASVPTPCENCGSGHGQIIHLPTWNTPIFPVSARELTGSPYYTPPDDDTGGIGASHGAAPTSHHGALLASSPMPGFGDGAGSSAGSGSSAGGGNPGSSPTNEGDGSSHETGAGANEGGSTPPGSGTDGGAGSGGSNSSGGTQDAGSPGNNGGTSPGDPGTSNPGTPGSDGNGGGQSGSGPDLPPPDWTPTQPLLPDNPITDNPPDPGGDGGNNGDSSGGGNGGGGNGANNPPVVTDVPEPASLALVLAGLIGVLALRRRRPVQAQDFSHN